MDPGERESDGGRNSSFRGGAAIAGDVELAGVRETRPTGHGVPNRGHKEDAGTMASSPPDKTWPEVGSHDARHDRQRGGARRRTLKRPYKAPIAKGNGRERRGGHGESHHGKNGGGEDSGTADHAEGRTANHRNLRRGGCGLRGMSEGENWSGEAVGVQ